MTAQPPRLAANNGSQSILQCCACNTPVQGGAMRFPKCPRLKATWVETIIAKSLDYPGRKERLEGIGLHLCTDHFSPSMLIRKEERGCTTYALKKGGVPTIFNNALNKINGSNPEVMDVDSTTPGDDEISICYETSANTSADVKNGEISAPNVVPVDNTAQSNLRIVNTESLKPEVLAESEMLSSSEPVSKTDYIESLQQFVSSLKLKDDKYYQPWRVTYSETSVLFVLFDGDCKYLVQSFTVDINLIVSVYYHGQLFTDSALTDVLGQDFKLDTWTKFKKLVLLLHTLTSEKQHHTMQLKHVCQVLNNCIETGPQFGCTPKDIKKWKFLLDQLQHSIGEDQNFSSETLAWAVNAYCVNRPGYAKIYESDVISLPHPATLELFKRHAMQQAGRLQHKTVRLQPQLPLRTKIVSKTPAVRPSTSGIRNGLNPPNLGNLMPNVSAGSTTTPLGQNGFSIGNGASVEEIEIEE